MTKQIKLQNRTYERLDQIRAKGETFDTVVDGLLDARDLFGQFINDVDRGLKLTEWSIAELQRRRQQQPDEPSTEEGQQ